MSNDVSVIYVLISWVFQCSFSAFWRAENAISAHSLTGLIKSIILDIQGLGLEISANTTSFLI